MVDPAGIDQRVRISLSAKNHAISVLAVSGASLPCTVFSPIDDANRLSVGR